MRKVPVCKRCGNQHYNVQACPVEQVMPEGEVSRTEPEDFRYSKGWGQNVNVPTVWTHDPVRHGSVTYRDGETV